MPAASPRSKPPALPNPATPGRALWNVTSLVRPDPIPGSMAARVDGEAPESRRGWRCGVDAPRCRARARCSAARLRGSVQKLSSVTGGSSSDAYSPWH